MSTFAGISIRTALGAFAGIIAGLFGYLVVSAVWPPGRSALPYIAGLVTGSGVCAGLGASIAWLKLDASRELYLRVLMLGLVGGVAGGWSGYFYGKVVYEDALFSRDARIATILSAVVVTNAALLGNMIWSSVRSSSRRGGTGDGPTARQLHQEHF